MRRSTIMRRAIRRKLRSQGVRHVYPISRIIARQLTPPTRRRAPTRPR